MQPKILKQIREDYDRKLQIVSNKNHKGTVALIGFAGNQRTVYIF